MMVRLSLLRALRLTPRSAAAAAAAAAKIRREPNADLKPFSAIPGPKPLPILGNLLELRKNAKNLHIYVHENLKKYGEIVKLVLPGGKGMVFTADPALLEDVLRGEGKYPVRPGNDNIQWIYKNRLNLPVSIAFADGKYWKHLRSAIGKQIMPRNVYSYTGPLSDICQHFTDSLRSFRDENGVVSDIIEPLRLLLIELSARFVYGIDIKVVNGMDEDSKKLGSAMKDALEGLSILMNDPPLFKLYPTKGYRLFVTGVKKVMTGGGAKHAERVKERIASGADEGETAGMLEQWLRDGKLTEEEAVAQSVSMFSGGVETTANQAVFLIYEMAKRPEIQEKLHAEIKSVLGDSKQPTIEDIQKMSYMKGCVLESFRWNGTVPIYVRYITQDMRLGEYHIPAKTTVVYCNYSAAKDEKLFPNPEKFDPERWKRDERNAFAMLPFGFGPRGCYGKRFAELELKLILIQMVRNFLMSTDMEEIPTEFAASLRPTEKVHLNLVDRRA